MPELKEYKKLYEFNDFLFLFDWNDNSTLAAKIKNGEGFSKFDTDLGFAPASSGYKTTCKSKMNLDFGKIDKDMKVKCEVKADHGGNFSWITEADVLAVSDTLFLTMQDLDDNFKNHKLLLKGAHGPKGTPLEAGYKIDTSSLKLNAYVKQNDMKA